ncbi:RAD9, HUS1, RAD1-interacting nuclear orphan protein 1 [Heterodontus francisci]|uniref:RAD9, HUS1, RAD1-interacting nuclear orphan protein 1 n=1 Tax=Heterodontus francisci TaxID=7792 RepID=UPI00355BCA5B
MPRKKKPSQSKKPPLLFLESPQKGEKCMQVVPLPAAVNPRQVACVPVDQKSSFTWVLPQFEFSDTIVRGPRREHKCNNKSDSTAQHRRNCIKKQSAVPKAGTLRKSHVNFVPLTFLGSDELPVQKENHKIHLGACQKVGTHGQARLPTNKTSFMGSTYQRCRDDSSFGRVQNSDVLGPKLKCRARSVAKGILVGKMSSAKNTGWNIPHSSVKCSSFSPSLYYIKRQSGADSGDKISLSDQSDHFSQSSDEVFTLPQVSTPTIDGLLPIGSLRKNIGRLRDRQPDRHDIPFHGKRQDCLDICSGLNYDFSEESLSAEVLVQDTPEHEYGLKATWRRRPHIMQYLKDHGKLTSSEVLVDT